MKRLMLLISSVLEFVTIRFLWRALFVGALVIAMPEGGKVIEGEAIITSPSSQIVQVGQKTDKAILEWHSFNLGSQERVQFVQPSASSIALNRINPQQGVSQIYGQLTANGRIILVNQAGIYFGPGARIDVAGIIASTSNISNINFLAGNYIFNEPSLFRGSIVNEGTIIARNYGLIALLGIGVSNNGLILARLGYVVLASGNKFTLDFAGDSLINFSIDEAISQAGLDKNGKLLTSGVSNTGTILARGGVIFLAARSVRDVLDNSINMKGVAVASSVSQHKGEIILSGGEEGTVTVSGRLDVSSKKHIAGTIKILGKNIQVDSSAVISASGKTGGGEILIGGAAHGMGPEQNAAYVYVAPGASIAANALLNGSGGNVIVWSNESTRFYGNISVQGGSLGGSGGFVETSSKNYLDVNGGAVNALAAYGNIGTWLLDPTNIYIALNQANATAAGMIGTDTSANTSTGVNPKTFVGAGAILDSLITTGNLITALGSANVIITTTNTSGTGAGNITIVDPFSWTSANTLTLTAANNITINGAITTGAAGSALILNAAGSVIQTAEIGGSGGLTQQGLGTVTLSQVNAYSGATVINAGALIISGSGTAASSTGFTVNQGSTFTLDNSLTNNLDRITGTLTLNGGQFIFKGTNVVATNAAESVGALNLVSGYSTITAHSGTGGSTTLTFASVTRFLGATLLLRGVNLGAFAAAGSTNIMFTASDGLNLTGANTSEVNKPIVPFAIGDTASGSTGFGFVTYNINPTSNAANTTGIRPLALATEYTTSTATAGDNLKLDTASVSPNVNRAFNSLLFSGGRTYTIGSGGVKKTLTITSGAVFSATGATNTITGRVNDVLALGEVEGKFFEIGNLTHSGSLFSGTGGLATSGSGVYLESRSVSVSGGLIVNSGTMRSGIANAFATDQPLTVRAGGTLDLAGFNNSITTLTMESGATLGASVTTGAGTLTLGGDITLHANGLGAVGGLISGNLALGANRIITVADGSASSDLTISALVSGANVGVTKEGSGTLTLSHISSSYMGQTIINAGTLSVPVLANSGAVSSIGRGSASPIINIGATGILQYTGTGDSTSRAIALTASGGSIDASGSGALTLSGGITGGTFGLNLIGTGAGIESGVIGITSGTLTKSGSGTWTLSNTNTYSGATTISSGKLSLGVVGALGASSSTTVSATNAVLDITFNSGTLTNTNTINLNGTGISGAGALTITGNSDTLNNPIVLQSSSTIGGTGTGTLVLGGPITGTSANLTINLTSAGISLPTTTLTTSGNLSVTAGGSIIQTGVLTIPGTSSFSLNAVGSDILLGTQPNNLLGAITFGGTLGNIRDIELRNINASASLPTNLNSLTNLRNLTVIYNNGALVLNNPITASNSIILSGLSFTNNVGAAGLNPGLGYFLVWTVNPSSDNRGGLVYQFKQYNASYGVTPVAGTGSGFLYTVAPNITPALTGSVSKSYTGTSAATLASSNYTFSGSIDGDTVTLNNPVSGTFGSVDAGTNITISVSGITIISATDGTATVYGYQITPTANATIGAITPASLTITANNRSKTYGQTVTFTGSEFTPTGLQNSETVSSVTLSSGGAVNTAGVTGSPYSITPSAATGGTFDPANYSISYVNGALTVNPAALTITGNSTSKTYGQTVTFTGTEFTPTGLKNSETVGSVTLSSGGAANTAGVTGSPYVINTSAATGGTFDLANYTVSYVSGALTVNPATLTYTSDKISRLFGEANPVFSGIVIGFVLGQTEASATTGTKEFNTSATVNSSAGGYSITGSGLAAIDNNYIFTQAAGNATALTINSSPIPQPTTQPSPLPITNKQLIVSVVTPFASGSNEGAGVRGLGGMSPSGRESPSIVVGKTIIERPAELGTIAKEVTPSPIIPLNLSSNTALSEMLSPLFMKEITEHAEAVSKVKSLTAIVSLGLLALASFLLLGNLIYLQQVARTNEIAELLTKASFNNYLEGIIHPEWVVPIVNATDVAKLLLGGLSFEFEIEQKIIRYGGSVVCILKGPLYTKAFFMATGVRRYPDKIRPLAA